MTIKLRLFASITLGVVAAAVAHGQAFSTAYSSASIQITGYYYVFGANTSLYEQILGGSPMSYGPYGYGNAASYSSLDWSSDGTSTSAYAFASADPNGHVNGSIGVQNGILFKNPNSGIVQVYFTGVTTSSSYSYQLADGDSAYAEASSELTLNGSLFGYAPLQGSYAATVTDNSFGLGNYTEEDNSIHNYTQYHYQFYGDGSPFYLDATIGQTQYWTLVLQGHEEISVYETSTVSYFASATMPSSTTPGPASVAPFAAGLLAALRRRAKKR
jgi:hypothetical protein